MYFTLGCNSFGVIRHLLKIAKIAITHSILAQNQENQKNIRGHENSLGLFFDKKCVTVIFLEKTV